jgi:hypothetical protein
MFAANVLKWRLVEQEKDVIGVKPDAKRTKRSLADIRNEG